MRSKLSLLIATVWLTTLGLGLTGSVPAAREAAAEAVLHLPASVGSWSGEILHADRYDLGQPIKLTCKVDAPVNATVARRWYGDGLKIRRLGDGSSVYVWGDAGEKSVRCLVAVYEPGETPQLEVRQYRAKFTIGPAPPPKPLNELVDAETAAKLAECLRTTVAGLKIASPASPAEFLATFTAYVGTKGLTDNAAWPVILARVEKAAPDGKPFDSAAVQGVLTATADELSKAPEPPVEPNKPTDPDAVKVSFDGFAVLVLEASEAPSYELRNAMASAAVREYLTANTTKIAGAAGWRLWDATPEVPEETYLRNAPPQFRELWAVKRPAAPCLVIASKGKAKAYPYEPGDPMALVSFLKQHGGP